MESFKMNEVFGPEELDAILLIFREGLDPGALHARLRDEIIEPALPRIEALTQRQFEPNALTLAFILSVMQGAFKPTLH